MKQAKTPEFQSYQKQIVSNAQELSKKLQEKGYTCVSGTKVNNITTVTFDCYN